MNFKRFPIEGPILAEPVRHFDYRGHFVETFNAELWRREGVNCDWVQDNASLSLRRGTLRGLHFQRPPHAQAKLVRVIRGSILDFAVDIRKASPSFGKHVSAVLSGDNARQLYVPEGFAHGFVTLTDDAEVAYKVSSAYAPQADSGICWDDPDLGLDWGVEPSAVIVSPKDRLLSRLAELDNPF